MIRFRGGAARRAALAVVVFAAFSISISGQNPPPQKPQTPIFRTEANYVHVDAYPTRDGTIVEGLTAADFEVLEDGKPQTVDAVQFIRFEPFTSDVERHDPNSQREAFELAGDPRYRVFVIYLDMYHTNLTGSHDTRQPLVNMLNRLAEIDFGQRMRDLLRAARQSNVAFYTINPQGLEAPTTAAGMDGLRARLDTLKILANNTDGVAIVDTNDLNTGINRVATDLSAYYVLGYYTTNTKWDGQVRKISVRLKGTNMAVRARREYRAPTEAEMATMRAALTAPAVPAAPSPVHAALATLARMRPDTTVLAHGALAGSDLVVVTEIAAPAIEAGRWKSGADVEVIVSDGAGTTVASRRGRIEPGARAALVRVPVGAQPGPWTVAAQVRASGEPDQYDRIRVARAAGPLGDPLVYRALPSPVSPLRPAAVFQFRRTERIHVEWPILQPLDRREARLLGRNGAPLALEITMTERDVDGANARRRSEPRAAHRG